MQIAVLHTISCRELECDGEEIKIPLGETDWLEEIV